MSAVTRPGRARRVGPRHSRGTSLIEVLVTVVVFAIGLLGIAGIQVQSKRSNFEAIQRSTASLLAHDIVERMRTNAGGLGTYLANGAALGGNTLGNEPTPNCQGGTSCASAELALHDLWEWERAIDGSSEASGSGGLVAPTACISGPLGGGTGAYTVAIAWRGQAELTNPTGNDCGVSTGNYDRLGGDNVYRRLLFVEVFITQ